MQKVKRNTLNVRKEHRFFSILLICLVVLHCSLLSLKNFYTYIRVIVNWEKVPWMQWVFMLFAMVYHTQFFFALCAWLHLTYLCNGMFIKQVIRLLRCKCNLPAFLGNAVGPTKDYQLMDMRFHREVTLPIVYDLIEIWG